MAGVKIADSKHFDFIAWTHLRKCFPAVAWYSSSNHGAFSSDAIGFDLDNVEKVCLCNFALMVAMKALLFRDAV
jgi:hypothetical protein